jgi:hypothetical protein
MDRKPGSPNDDSDISQTSTGTSTYFATISNTNTFADLQGRRMVYMRPPAPGQITPTLVASSSATNLSSAALDEDAKDDPYEMRLDGTSNNDATYSIAELERILRANDPDALQLPQRLAAGLEDAAQISRMTITTDSWDTPALTGLAARRIEDSLANTSLLRPLVYSGTAWRSGSNAKSNAISPDIAAGLRFNINRPVASGTTAAARAEQHEYCKGLYTLVLLLGGTAADKTSFKERAAQWAVNVLDFRDPDSESTPFEYDRTIKDGWEADSVVSAEDEDEDEDEDDDGDDDSGLAVVWGVEKPDIVITETAAWADVASGSSQLFVTIHRPAATLALGDSAIPSGNLPLPGWQIRLHHSTSSGKAVSLAGVSGTIPQWVAGKPAAITTTILSGSFSPSPFSGLGVSGSGSYLCIHPTAPVNFIPAVGPTLQLSGSSFALPATATTGTVTLERLLDPSLPNTKTNPYIAVDRAPVRPSAITGPFQTQMRPAPADAPSPLVAFWRNVPTGWKAGGATLGQYAVTASKPAAWFHWPNRPFISIAELALVPSDDADSLLPNYSFPSSSLVNSGSSVLVSGSNTTLGELLLDAVHVPSRFAGNTQTLTGTAASTAARFGLEILQSGTTATAQLSKWREPGKVNANTIVSGTAALTDNATWTTLVGGTAINLTTGTVTANPFTQMVSGSVTPADSTRKLLSLSSTGTAIATGTFSDLRNSNPYFPYSQAIRLANTATIRSQVFAVWITVKITDDSPNAPSPVTKRMFAIIDRSIPVGYAPGQDLNVRDTIRLKRYLD